MFSNYKESKVLFSKDLDFNKSDMELQKQRLYTFFSIKKGDLFWDTNFGLDSKLFLANLKIGSVDSIKNYLVQIALDMNLDLADVEVKLSSTKLNIKYYFLGSESLEIEKQI